MKKLLILSAAALSLVTGVAFAGSQEDVPVVVDLDSMFASGDQYTARTSKNDVEFIGCGTRIFDVGMGNTFSFGFCQATDSEETSFTCFTESAVLVDAINNISDFAFISFSWDEDGNCTRVGSSTQSFYLPNFTVKGKN